MAGAVMLVTGAIYTLIGIKNRYIHTFFSTAYLAALGISVLIVYVMSVPVSTALQGGYVAAIILSGSAIGVGSIFFKELTEGLGCALGGFCVSMWLLTLVPGGLLKPVPSKAIFMSAFTLVAFAFYFSRYTRDWALITMISFSGATVIVLGIDCFSRAGLKEFWAYVWQLNKNLFPLGADTYPVTKGIRVEAAAIIIIFLVGIISQIKLWRIVRDKREQRAAARAEGQRNLEQEEEDVGREVEERTRRERREWERAYGNGEAGSSAGSRVSGDGASEKKLTGSFGRNSEVEVIEMSDMSGSDREQPEPAPLTGKDEDGKLTVRVVQDDIPEGVEESDEEMPKRSALKSQIGSPNTRHQPQPVATEPPEVVPLPFSVPNNDDAKSHNSRSSIATFADEEEEVAEVPVRRDSFAKRLSQGSSKLLRNLSPRSSHHMASPEIGGESSEELVIPKAERDDDQSSLAATLDNQSIDDGSRRASLLAVEQGKDIEIDARLSTSDTRPELEKSARSSMAVDDKQQTKGPRPTSTDTVPTHQSADVSNKKSEIGAGAATLSGADDTEDVGPAPSERPAKSTASGVSSRASLTKERLPRSLSRVAMSYRTNEWAKHLSYADAPEPDELKVVEATKPTKPTKPKSKKGKGAERPAPVNVEELQQTNEAGVQPALIRSESRNSMQSVAGGVSRKESKQAIPPSMSAPMHSPIEREQSFSPPLPPANPPMSRSASAMGLRRTSTTFEPIAEERDIQAGPQPIQEEDRPTSTTGLASGNTSRRGSIPGVVSYNSPQTLLGQRELFLKSKSQGNLLAQTPEPYVTSRPPSEAGSISNYPMYAAALGTDADDIPLSQRKQIMHRHNSMMSLAGSHASQQPQPLQRSSSGFDLNTTEHAPFNSHQPNRTSTVPTPAAREAALANFRASVSSDLNRGSAMITPSGRETPFASTNNLLSKGREAEVQRNIQMQRNMLLGQKEAERKRGEREREHKEWIDRAFDERMRSGELMGAHREAMRKMQSGEGSKSKK